MTDYEKKNFVNDNGDIYSIVYKYDLNIIILFSQNFFFLTI